MQRRQLLKGLAVALPGAAVTAAATSKRFVKETADQSLETLRTQVKDLKERFEKSDRTNKRLIKAALALAALSLGIDLSSLL